MSNMTYFIIISIFFQLALTQKVFFNEDVVSSIKKEYNTYLKNEETIQKEEEIKR